MYRGSFFHDERVKEAASVYFYYFAKREFNEIIL